MAISFAALEMVASSSHIKMLCHCLDYKSSREIAKEGRLNVGSDAWQPTLEFWLLTLPNFITLAKSLKIYKDSFS